MDYKFAGDFSKAAIGPFVNAEKKKVWADPQATVNQDFDEDGTWYEIVDDDRFPGGRACRMKYGKGRVGMADQSYQVRLPSPQTIANLEFLVCFEDGFSFYTPNAAHHGNGKIGPCIQWGPVGGSVDRGTRCMFWWNDNGSNYGKHVFQPTCQDQATGNQLVQPVKYGPPIVYDQIYKLRIQCMGGPQGYAKYWVDDKLIAETGPKNLMHDAQDDVFFDFAFFSGGSGPDYAPEHDSFARHGGVRYWSGSEYWAADTGNGDGGTDEGGGTTPPEPPAGEVSPFSLAVGETKIFRAHFATPPTADVKWSLTPNNVKWGKQAGPMWSAIEVIGQKAGQGCVLVATDPGTGQKTVPVNVDITEQPRTGICTVEALP